MRLRIIASVCLVICFALALGAQEARPDPVSGVWLGDYGQNPRERTPVQLSLEWDGKTLMGLVTTGEAPFELENCTFDPATGAIHIEVVVPGRGITDFHYKIDGKLINEKITGTWRHEGGEGDFQIEKVG